MSKKLDPELEAMARASGEAVARLRDIELRAYFSTPKISYKPETNMQKTDAELIAEAEKWRAFSGPWTLSLVHEVRVVADELARRLKAANSENHRLRNRWWMNVISEVGVYPAAVSGGDAPYEKRTEFMEGWNACVMQYGIELTKALEEGFLDKEPVWPGDL